MRLVKSSLGRQRDRGIEVQPHIQESDISEIVILNSGMLARIVGPGTRLAEEFVQTLQSKTK